MIDIHPPQHAAMTRRDFFVHLGIVVLGILIAIGLEQSVEYFHHRHQVVETRRALQQETALNIRLFAIQTEEFNRFAPRLLTDVAVLHYLRDHPHAPPQQWPGTIDLVGFYLAYTDTNWIAAQQSGVLNYMPPSEVARFGNIYTGLQKLTELENSYREAIHQVGTVFISQPDPSQFTPAQIETANSLMAQVLLRKSLSATTQLNLATYHPEFGAAPKQIDIDTLQGLPMTHEQNDARLHIMHRIAAAHLEGRSTEAH
jgi:hypothetical protein